MTRPTLLRRAAAAAIGVDRRPSHARALPLARGLTLTRRAGAAIIGVRADRLPAEAKTEVPARRAEAESAGGRPLSALPPLVTLGAPERPPPRERSRRGLILATAAAIMAVAFGTYVHHEGSRVVEQPPAHRPTGVLPERYLGTWKSSLEHKEGSHARTMVIRQGYVDDTVMTLTAVGPRRGGDAYRCVFEARLDSVTSRAVRLGSSVVTSGKPLSACAPGKPSTLTLVGEDKLRRADRDGAGKLTYKRSQ
ncbi:hypothetical protein [Streptomyces sp. NRRL S-920]|uniref:hypothetical protein n=1 Tax=Streptomyces sp. NRRL S-920 TaxID=1463921 RepID=UPI0004C7FF51|nr:hypothetical protein [Streptomyces sp. NRRL S-920]